MRALVLLACHDRRDLTVRAVTSAASSLQAAGIEARFFLFDDGSSDGTSAAVEALPVPVEIIRGDGSAFWAKGMSEAERAALQQGDEADALIWLNDDVHVDADAFVRLRAEFEQHPAAIVVGAVRDVEEGSISFSGYDRLGRHPLRLREVQPGRAARPIDTMNGNVVLVPTAVARRMGGIDGGFSHGLADIDYGLRASKLRIPIVLGPGTYGLCPGTPDRWYPRDYPTVRAAWRGFTGIKGGGNPASLRRVLRRHGGARWPFYLLWTYSAWWVRNVGRAVRRRTGTRTASSARGLPDRRT